MYLFNIPLIISIIIIIHHFIKHRYDTHLTFIDKFVQLSDIDNHETWALFFLGISIGMSIISFKTSIYHFYQALKNNVINYIFPANVAIKGFPDEPINAGQARVASFVALS